MWPERPEDRSRALLALALLITVLGAIWASTTPPSPNSDRYDYLGRAEHLLHGRGPAPLVVYPLRLTFPGAQTWPVTNLTRPPLWPPLVALGLRLGAADRAGVIMATLFLLMLLFVLRWAADRVFAPPSGGFAALALAAAYSTVRAQWGGGPELAMALVTTLAWTWNGAGRTTTGLVLGALGGLLLSLHPVGALYLVLVVWARRLRDAPRTLLTTLVVALVVGGPWYLQAGRSVGVPLAPLQGVAEWAKAVDDPAGMGPYRGLEPMPTLHVLRDRPGTVLRHTAHDLRELLVHLDAWMAWPVWLLALLGTRRDPSLARRDLALGALAMIAVATVARDPRLLVPLSPIVAGWAGAGWQHLDRRWPRTAAPASAALLVALPWLLPLGVSMRPGAEIAAIAREQRDPSDAAVRAYGALGGTRTPIFTDSAVLAWRARRGGILLPDGPATLDRLQARLPWLAHGSFLFTRVPPDHHPWLQTADWQAWIRAHGPPVELPSRAGFVLPTRRPSPAGTEAFVPAPLALSPQDRPDSLAAIPVPPATREGLRLRPDALDALLRMVSDAAAEGVELRVISGYRSYERQRVLYEDAVARHGAGQQWVAPAGASEHQLGTTVDFADAALRQVLEPGFAETPEGRWLARNAARYGWVRSYTEANRARTGYRPEAWHYRWYPPDRQEDGRP